MKKIILKSFFLALILLQVNNLVSQTFYETKFKDKKGNSYLGFMVYYSSNNCYMRVAFTESNVHSVVNVEYESFTGIEDGLNYLFLIGKNPKYITSNIYGGYNPEHFLWLWDPNNPTVLPFYTTDPEFKPENIYQVDYFKIIELSQLNEKYLRQFYISNDPDYFKFIEAKNNNIINHDISNITQNVTIHLFVVANTLISDIGQSCSIDKRNIISEFEGVAEALNVPLKKYIVDENRFSKSEITQKMNEIQANSNDVIVFLYSGHGFRYNDQVDSYPQLDLRINSYQQLSNETSISALNVYNSLVKKGARLTLVLFDCCNSNIGINQITNSSFLVTKLNKNIDNSKLSKLILKSNGRIIASAASPNEYSWCNYSNGGFFTSSFLESFRQEIGVLNTNPDWNNIINNSILYARNKTSPAVCPFCKIQNGIKFIKIKTIVDTK